MTMRYEVLPNGEPLVILPEEPELRAATRSFSALRTAMEDGRYALSGSWRERRAERKHIAALDSRAKEAYRLERLRYLSRHCSLPVIVIDTGDFGVTGNQDVLLLQAGATMLLKREEASVEHMREFHERNGSTYDEYEHEYGPRYMPALRKLASLTVASA